MKKKLVVLNSGLIDYAEAHRLQLRLVELRRSNKIPDVLILLEHPSVITLGRKAGSLNLRIQGIPVFKIERGGEATYHGPGQLVGYTIIDLEAIRIGVWEYVRRLEEVIIKSVREFGLAGYRVEKYPGVWVNGRKIASIGLALRRWIVYHGFALNVSTDLNYFKLIKPCGLEPDIMTSMEKELGRKVSMRDVRESIVKKFIEEFGYEEFEEFAEDWRSFLEI